MPSQVSPAPEPTPANTQAVDWSKVRLGQDFAPVMFIATWTQDTQTWSAGQLVPYGPLQLMPAAQVLNYGQSIFEGMKAYRAANPEQAGWEVALFRPHDNARRFAEGAMRMAMPPVPEAMYVRAVEAVVRANISYVPPSDKGSLYLRPLLLGTAPLLGLCPAASYTFCVYACPVPSRAKDGKVTPVDFMVEESMHRAAPRGIGSTKAAGNYSPCLAAQARARTQGCLDVVYLDAVHDRYLEEGSACNIFVVTGNCVRTPPARGSILPGITRASILHIARRHGYDISEEPIDVSEAMQADEMFATGTAVVVMPIGSLTYKGARHPFLGSEQGHAGPVTTLMFKSLTDVQFGKAADPYGWMHPVSAESSDSGDEDVLLACPGEAMDGRVDLAVSKPTDKVGGIGLAGQVAFSDPVLGS